jgi:hypothetical protein
MNLLLLPLATLVAERIAGRHPAGRAGKAGAMAGVGS